MTSAKKLHTTVQIVILYLAVFFLFRSLSFSTLSLGLIENLSATDLYESFTTSFIETNGLDRLQVLFIIGWFIVLLLTRAYLKKSFSATTASFITLILLPVYTVFGIVHPVLFDWLAVLIILYSTTICGNNWLKWTLVFIGVLISSSLGSYYGMVLVPLVYLLLLGKKWMYLGLAGILVWSLIPLVSGTTIIERIANGLTSYHGFWLDLVSFELGALFSSALSVVCLLSMFMKRKELDKSTFGLLLFVPLAITVEYHLQILVVVSIILVKKKVLFSTTELSGVAFLTALLTLPFVGTLAYQNTFNTIQWQMGIDPVYDDLGVVARRLDIEGSLYNNERTSGLLNYYFPHTELFIDSDKFSDSLENIFEHNTIDVMSWIQYRMDEDIKAIYFNLENEKNRYLEFLGQRLMDGEWALLAHREEQYALLVRREEQFQDVIDRYEIVPTL